jgi:ABC-type multidrug transport system permease subunit
MFDNIMNDGEMHGWMHSGMWIWPVLAILVAVLIVFVVIKLRKK